MSRHALVTVAASVFLCLSPLASVARAWSLQSSAFTVSPPAPSPLTGNVLDPNRAPIAGARVVAVPASGASTTSTVTDARGAFALALDAGAFTLTVSGTGFLDRSQSVTIRPGDPLELEFVLALSGFRDTVTVAAPGDYRLENISSATKTATPLRDVPQAVTVVSSRLIKDQLMTSLADVVRYVPGIAAHQGENNRDQVVIRGNSSSADFFINGVRDDVQYYRDLYNLERVEALKGPNAMIFGRGGGGGVINRVSKEASAAELREITVQGGAHGEGRVSADVDHALTGAFSARVNGVYEHSGSFRDDVHLERYGVSPTVTFAPHAHTKVVLRYERFRDVRVADRGVSSFQGRPVDVATSSYFGNPDDSHVRANVNTLSAAIEQHVGGVTIRNQTLAGHYDRFYQNYVPGAVTADKSRVALTAYNNDTARLNLFNQADITYAATTGRVHHALLVGAELGRQTTDNLRNTGFFDNAATSSSVPYDDGLIDTPVTFRQSATDADNRLRTIVAAAYAQDQIALSRPLQVVAGVRVDHFDLTYHNNRNGDTIERPDTLLSPRVGLVVKPMALLSVYTSYSVSSLPSSGDQFSSLTTITQQVEPERFRSSEVGVKWDATSDLSLTAATYRLDRTNTRSTDPSDPTRIVQTGSQRTNGFEFGMNGHVLPAWNVAGGYAYQNAFVTSRTTAAAAGAHVGQVPHQTLSIWNRCQLSSKFAVGLGLIHRTDMFAAIDDTVTLPGFTRVDVAAYYAVTGKLRLQLNLENATNRAYYTNADSNTNISPGAPRAVRVALMTSF